MTHADLSHKLVFLRADLNVPLLNGSIMSDFRLQAVKPTIDLLIKKNACIILATHIGRPDDREESLSTDHLIGWFIKQAYSISWAANIEEASHKSKTLAPATLLLLENLRFFKGERRKRSQPQETTQFVRQLRDLADYYVNDAFASLHENDASITLLPELYAKKDKTCGLLIEREVNTLSSYFEYPVRPFMLIIGGGKVKDKLPFLEKLIYKVDQITTLLALALTFLKAQG